VADGGKSDSCGKRENQQNSRRGTRNESRKHPRHIPSHDIIPESSGRPPPTVTTKTIRNPIDCVGV
jgi:hypothetical protein